jgi:hypothetical protein
MSCCEGGPGEDLPTVRNLIHDLTSPWIDQAKPVYVVQYDEAGNTIREFVVTGARSTAAGQSLELRPVEP